MGDRQDRMRGFSRRSFLRTAGISAAGLAAPGPGEAKTCPASAPAFDLTRKPSTLPGFENGRRPNILFIVTDQERWHGNLPPTLDRPNHGMLRQNGVSFENAFCATPLCSPSRSAMFSGLYPHQNGVTSNMMFPVAKAELPKDQPHLGSVLRSAGYRIGYKGKWDLSKGPRYYLADFSDRGRAGDYGFEGHCGKVPDQEYGYPSDDQVAREACQWIEAAGGERPWFMCCSIVNPHDICHPRLKPDESIRPDAVVPESWRDTLEDKPDGQRKRRDNRLSLDALLHPGVKTKSEYEERDWKLFLSFYYDLIEGTDKYIGWLIEALDRAGIRDDTVIVYTSDHGELGGAHGFAGKYEGYEEDLHVPLLVHHPGLAKKEVGALVSNIDLAATIAGLAGVEWPGPVEGDDLGGWLSGEGVQKEAVFAEAETDINLAVYKQRDARRMVRTHRWKYSYSFQTGQGQLYDLDADPHEMHNLFGDPARAAVRREMEERLRLWMIKTGDYYRLP